MKHRHILSLVTCSLTLGAVAATSLPACSSSETTPSTATVKKAPARPAAPATTETSTRTFAVKQLFLGDAPRTGAPTSTAWKKFGYDLDGKTSTQASTDVCKPPAGGENVAREDGDQGIDNSFGRNLMQTIIGLSPSAATDVQTQLVNGSFTLLLSVTGLSDDPKQTATGLKGFMNAGGIFDPSGQTKPNFGDKALDWPVQGDLLADAKDPKSSRVKFSDAYIAGGTWVSGSDSVISLTLNVGGRALGLNITKAQVTFEHSAPNVASGGVIAGILNTNELIAALAPSLARLDPKLCSADKASAITDTIRGYSDILTDGTQDPSKDCNGISIGLGFEAVEVANPTKVAPTEPAPPDPCTDPGDAGAKDAAQGG